MKIRKIIRIAVLLMLVAAAAAAIIGVWGYLLPYQKAKNTMSSKEPVVMMQQEDGTIRITWPEGDNADRYLLQILRTASQEIIHSAAVEGTNTYIMQALPADEKLTIRIYSANSYKVMFDSNTRIRMGDKALQITGKFSPPTIRDLDWTSDPDAQSVTVKFQMDSDNLCRVYYVDGSGQQKLVNTLDRESMTLVFGDKGDYPLPEDGQSHTFAFQACCMPEGFVYYGVVTQKISVGAVDLKADDLNFTLQGGANNSFTFTWQETEGEFYAIQQFNEGTQQWETLLEIATGGNMRYTTKHLPRYSEHKFRVVAVGGPTITGSDFSAVSRELRVKTDASIVFSTIWPIKDLKLYTGTDKKESIGTAPQGEAYCILDFQDNMFYVRHGSDYGWIDSDYCMINLPEMIGDICLYDIANSYSSLFMVHEYAMPHMTGTVIEGYESIKQHGNKYLVPLLFPVSLKLEKAAFSAMEKGYKLKIYDSYRPQDATKDMYYTAKDLLDSPVPALTYNGKPVTDLYLLGLGEDEVLTYEKLMTDKGRYDLGYFLAAGRSRHNQGLAMDLTLVSMASGEDIRMQTSMHDLSWYSERGRNNYNANLLKSIMYGAGFGGIVSEWWHFQDDEAFNRLNLPYMSMGVDANCWVADDEGWRYRQENGQFITGKKTIDGITYTFDRLGYVTDAMQA